MTAGNLSRAATCAGIDRKAHYDWLATDEQYRQDYAQAIREAAQTIEDEAIRRAVKGVLRPVIHRGRIVEVPVLDSEGKPVFDEVADEDGVIQRVPRLKPLMEREYSDSLMQSLLRGWMPEKYGRTEHTGPGGGPINHKIEIEFVDVK